MGSEPSSERRICIGRFAAPHGVTGHVRVETFTEKPDSFFRFSDYRLEPGEKRIEIEKVGTARGGFIVRVMGISSPEEARTLRGKKIYIPRSALAPVKEAETFYRADLGGLKVRDQKGAEIGYIEGFHNYGAGDLIEIRLKTPRKGIGPSLVVPFRDETIRRVDLKKGEVVADLTGWL